jgi:hypothetical protein
MFDVGESNAKYVYTPCQRGLAKARSRWADLRGRVEISGPPKEDRQTRKNPRLSINGGGCIEMFDSVILFPIHFHMYIYISICIYSCYPSFFHLFFVISDDAADCSSNMRGMVYSGYNLGTIRVVSHCSQAKQLRPGPGLLEEQLSALRFLDLHGRPIGS